MKGFELVKEFFVDSSGFGQEDEAALTVNTFNKELESLIKDHGVLTAKITGVGQFQVYVGMFKKVGKSKIERISTNVLKRFEDDKTIYRLYDTDILTVDGNKMTFNTGGFDTRTTSKWMNELQRDVLVSRKNWEMYAEYQGKAVKFEDNKAEIML